MSDAETTQTDLEFWWACVAEDEAKSVIPKTIEYGAGGGDNMAMLGMVLATAISGGAWIPSKAKAIELATAFYIQSKITRWINALAHGMDASDDTLHDIACYLKIAQRTRKVGGWPNGPEPDKPRFP